MDLAPQPPGINDVPGAKSAMKGVGKTVGGSVETVGDCAHVLCSIAFRYAIVAFNVILSKQSKFGYAVNGRNLTTGLALALQNSFCGYACCSEAKHVCRLSAVAHLVTEMFVYPTNVEVDGATSSVTGAVTGF